MSDLLPDSEMYKKIAAKKREENSASWVHKPMTAEEKLRAILGGGGISEALMNLGGRTDVDAQVERCGLLMQHALTRNKLGDYYRFMLLQCQLLGYVEAAKAAARSKPAESFSEAEEKEARRKSEEYYRAVSGGALAPDVEAVTESTPAGGGDDEANE